MMMQEAAPVVAQSPWLDPRFLLMAAGALVALIAYALRVEFKTNANEKRQADYEEAMSERVDKLESNMEKVKAAHYGHAGDTSVHHNKEAFDEFRRGLDSKFSTMDRKMDDMSRSVETKFSEIKQLIIGGK